MDKHFIELMSEQELEVWCTEHNVDYISHDEIKKRKEKNLSKKKENEQKSLQKYLYYKNTVYKLWKDYNRYIELREELVKDIEFICNNNTKWVFNTPQVIQMKENISFKKFLDYYIDKFS